MSTKLEIKPEQVTVIIRDSYGLTVDAIKHLDGYDDKNYFIKISKANANPFITKICEDGYVLKIMNSLDSKHESFVTGQHELVKFLDSKKIKAPLPVKNLNGETYSVQKLTVDGHIVRLMEFIPGKILVDTSPTNEMLNKIGEFVGNMTVLLKDFKHEGFDNRSTIWMLENVLSIKQYLGYIENQEKLKMVKKVLEDFEKDVLPNLNDLERGLIHGDINENNLVVREDSAIAILDFGDSHYSACIFDLTICICYMLIYTNDIQAGKYVVEGYLKNRVISEREKMIFKDSICARLCQSLVLGIYSSTKDPTNKYILSSQKVGWDILSKLRSLTNDQLLCEWGLN